MSQVIIRANSNIFGAAYSFVFWFENDFLEV